MERIEEVDVEIPLVEELYERAELMSKVFKEKSEDTEKRTFYAEDVHEQLKEQGFYKILLPKAFGGFEYDIGTFMKVVQILARGCPSAAWCYCFGASHAINICTMYDSSVWPEVFVDGHFISPLTVKPTGKLVEQKDGTWLLNGVYSYCSGVPYATHFSSQAIPVFLNGEEGKPVTFIAKRSDWERLDDWGMALGMKGSGSHSIRFENAVIPAKWITEKAIMSYAPTARGPGDADHGDNPMYYGRFVSYLIMEPASIAVGTLKGALDEYADVMKTRTTMRPPIVNRDQDTDYRRWFGEANAKVALAEIAINGMVAEWTNCCELNMTGRKPFSVQDEIRLILVACDVIKICWSAMDILWSTIGSSAAMDGQRMQRLFRDMAMMRSHALNTFADLMTREFSDEILETVGGARDSFFNSGF